MDHPAAKGNTLLTFCCYPRKEKMTKVSGGNTKLFALFHIWYNCQICPEQQLTMIGIEKSLGKS